MTASAATPAKKNNVLEEAQAILAECEKGNVPVDVYARLGGAFQHDGHINKCKDAKGNSPIHIAANPKCSILVLTWLLDEKAHTGLLASHKVNVSASNNHDETPLMLAVAFKDEGNEAPGLFEDGKHQEVIKLYENRKRITALMKAGASSWEQIPSEPCGTVFIRAAAAGNFKFINEHLPLAESQVNEYLKHSYQVLFEVLHVAVKNNHLNIVKRILAKDSVIWKRRNQIPAREILHSAMQLSDQGILKVLLEADIAEMKTIEGYSDHSNSIAMDAIRLRRGEIPLIKSSDLILVLQTLSNFLQSRGRVLSYTFSDLNVAFTNKWLDVLRDHMQPEIEEYLHIPITHIARKTGSFGTIYCALRPLEAAVVGGDVGIVDLVLSKKPSFLQYKYELEAKFLSLILAIERGEIAIVKKLLAANPDYDLRQDISFIDKAIEKLKLETSPDGKIPQIIAYVCARLSAFNGDGKEEDQFVNCLDADHKKDYEKLPRPKKLVDRYASLPSIATATNDVKDAKTSVSSTALTLTATAASVPSIATASIATAAAPASAAAAISNANLFSSNDQKKDGKPSPKEIPDCMQSLLVMLNDPNLEKQHKSAIKYRLNELTNEFNRIINPEPDDIFSATASPAKSEIDDDVDDEPQCLFYVPPASKKSIK